jgi:hypothetical protein
MDLLHLFRSSTPLRNPIGFGASDFIELAFALLLGALFLCRPWLTAFARRFAHRTIPCMLLLALLPVALRLALLLQSPVPTPAGADDFSYVLLGDTLAHLRLSNPPHPFPQFFEAIFVLQQPTYSSIFPLGQGIVLALGALLFGLPWAGVVLSVAALCALVYWMLRVWTTPMWALLGGLLAVVEFGPLSQWMNSYWGGAVSAIAGCLVFGSLPRLLERPRSICALLLGLGLGLQLLTRPFEFLLLLLSVGLVLVPVLKELWNQQQFLRVVSLALCPLLAAAAFMLLQNKSVTGSWTTLPYMLSRYQYGVPATFTLQPNPVPHRNLTPEQELDYRAQSIIHGDTTDTLRTYFQRLLFRIRYYRFFFLPPLYLALIAFCFTLLSRRALWIAATLLIFALGTNFYPYFYPHYIAALTPLFVLMSVTGLRKIHELTIRTRRVGRDAAYLLVTLCIAPFVFWYGVHLSGSDALSDILDYETWHYINYGDPEGRIAINNQLSRAPGKQLVFLHYGPQHRFHEWIHNAANIDGARTVWVHDLGPDENQKLIRYYRDRTVWLLEPDAAPPTLRPYPARSPASAGPFQSVSP